MLLRVQMASQTLSSEVGNGGFSSNPCLSDGIIMTCSLSMPRWANQPPKPQCVIQAGRLGGGGSGHVLNQNISHSYFLFTVPKLCFIPCEKGTNSLAWISCWHFSLVGVRSGAIHSEGSLFFILQLCGIFIKYQHQNPSNHKNMCFLLIATKILSLIKKNIESLEIQLES